MFRLPEKCLLKRAIISIFQSNSVEVLFPFPPVLANTACQGGSDKLTGVSLHHSKEITFFFSF